jgi:hypothetical protein
VAPRAAACTTTKYLRGAAGIGLGTTVKYRVNQNAGAGSNWAKTHHTKAGNEFAEPPCCVACGGLFNKLRV